MPRADRREQLLDATKAIVADDGFHAVSIDAVARRAGITRPIVYDHFGSLDNLLVALLERETSRTLGQLAERVSSDDDLAATFDRALAGRDLPTPDPELTGMLLQGLADEGARLLLGGMARERLTAHARW